MSREELQRRLSRLKDVPTLPRLLERVVAALEDPEVNFRSVAELIEVDQALTAQILRLANSAFYHLQGSVSSVSQALVTLGSVVTRSVAMSMTVFDIRKVQLQGFWEHSLGCAVAAGALAKVTGLARVEEATAAGLLHDLGKVIIYKEMPAVFDEIVGEAQRRRIPFRDVERAQLGIDHCDVAGWVVQRWRFPPCLAEPIMFHHLPGQAVVARDETAIVHVANTLVQAMGYGAGGSGRLPAIDLAAWERLRLTHELVDDVLDRYESDLDCALNFALFE